MLNLNDPPPIPPEDAGRRLRLVPRWPDVRFRRPEDPEVPWRVRVLGVALAALISIAAVTGIVALATLLKNVYDRVDAADRARAEERARESEMQSAPAGTIPVTLSDAPPDPNSPPGN